jgi:hypothetical protein
MAREREREKVWGGGSERHYRLEGSQAVPTSPSSKGFVQF